MLTSTPESGIAHMCILCKNCTSLACHDKVIEQNHIVKLPPQVKLVGLLFSLILWVVVFEDVMARQDILAF